MDSGAWARGRSMTGDGGKGGDRGWKKGSRSNSQGICRGLKTMEQVKRRGVGYSEGTV